MHVTVRVRVFLARHRWVYWCGVAMLSIVIGVAVFGRLRAVEEARSSWGTTSSVLVAETDLSPDGPIAVRSVELPDALLPADALHELPDGSRLHQRVLNGEVLTAADVVSGAGPAAHAEAGTAVIGIVDPLVRNASTGLRVQVTSEGVVLAETGTVMEVGDDVVFVAVDVTDAPMVAAAAQVGSASLIFLP